MKVQIVLQMFKHAKLVISISLHLVHEIGPEMVARFVNKIKNR